MTDRLGVVEQVISCTRCELHAQCTAPVPMRGEPGRIAIVGEAPGSEEDKSGKPFIGPAGKRLAEMLAEAGITEPTGICNTVSCFPHGTPQPAHIQACAVNRDAQLAYFNPRFVLLLGRVALRAMRADLDLAHGRARPFVQHGRIHFATYHPAAALRNGKFDTAMRRDLQTFSWVLAAEDPRQYIPDTCAACPIEAAWWEAESWLGWCPAHLPPGERPDFESRMRLVENDLAVSRARTIS